jgi:hypothetical protein
VTLEDGSREGTKCVPWLNEMRASFGEPIDSGQIISGGYEVWTARFTKVTAVVTSRKKRVECMIALEPSLGFPPQ